MEGASGSGHRWWPNGHTSLSRHQTHLSLPGTSSFLDGSIGGDHPALRIQFVGARCRGVSKSKRIERDPGRKLLVLVTDGRSNANVLSLEDAAKQIVRSGVAVSVIDIGYREQVRQVCLTRSAADNNPRKLSLKGRAV